MRTKITLAGTLYAVVATLGTLPVLRIPWHAAHLHVGPRVGNASCLTNNGPAALFRPVQQRMNGPPVYLNPFTNRIPGSILGPEDVKDA